MNGLPLVCQLTLLQRMEFQIRDRNTVQYEQVQSFLGRNVHLRVPYTRIRSMSILIGPAHHVVQVFRGQADF